MFLGAAVIGGLSYATMAANEPTIASPYSLTVVIPWFSVKSVAFGLWPAVFLLWGVPLFARAVRISRQSLVLAVVCVLLGGASLIIGWRDGVIHQGAAHVATLALVDIGVAMLLWFLVRRQREAASFGLNYAFHWLLFAWMAWGSIPWLGEGL